MQKVTDEIIRFMRGRYALDEVPGKHYEADCLRFRQGKKAIVTVIFYSKSGHRCDMCVHYTGAAISEEFRKELEERLTRVYNYDDWSIRCSGCGTPGCYTERTYRLLSLKRSKLKQDKE